MLLSRHAQASPLQQGLRSTDSASPVNNPDAPTLCAQCHLQLQSPTIRAMNSVFHKHCFVCADCGKSVLDKFFPMPASDGVQGSSLPLCELDFFRRKSLLCFVCGGALRGDYVMAVGHKYHLEHFTCSICPRVFQAEDNYYERDGSVYCHFHFSTLFADRCEGCHSAILKQFIENFRNGRHEHWHPECYMIHKSWNVRISNEASQLNSAVTDPGPYTWKEDSDLTPEMLKDKQKEIEHQVYRIWTVLSEYEEVSAACISDMLQYSTTGAVLDAVMATSRLIFRVQVIFSAIDNLQQSATLEAQPPGKEPKTLCKNIVNFLISLPGGSESSNALAFKTKDLLDLVTSMAQYLKLLIHYGLGTALSITKLSPETQSLEKFLNYLASNKSPPRLTRASIIPNITDQCMACKKGIEEKCARLLPKDQEDRRDRRWHLSGECFKCSRCSRPLSDEISTSAWAESTRSIICSKCVRREDEVWLGFTLISRLNQYSFLLNVALQRVFKAVNETKHTERSPKSDSHQSELVDGYVNTLTDIRRLRSTRFKRAVSDAKRQRAQRSKSTIDHDGAREQPTPSPTASLQRRRSNKRSNGHSTPSATTRDSPKTPPTGASPPSSNGTSRLKSSSPGRSSSPSPPEQNPYINDITDKSNILFGEKFLTLDDIPRIVAAEQAREQRPNAFRHQRQSSLVLGSGPAPKLLSQPTAGHHLGGDGRPENGNRNSVGRMRSVASSANSGAATAATNDKPVRYFSELLPVECFLVRHYAAKALRPLLAEYISMEEFNEIVGEPRSGAGNGSGKLGFWEKFGKAFSKNSASGNGAIKSAGGSGTSPSASGSSTMEKVNSNSKRKGALPAVPPGVFKVPLEVLVERSGTESELGVSGGPLKVPAFLDDVISAMRRKDMSVEGVFRKNGNIRKLKVLSEQIDGSVATPTIINYDAESPVQLAALLKKFLRDLPDPLLSSKLYRLWIMSQKIVDDDVRLRVLHLCCCLLPRAHRDSMEIIFNFLKWVASFSHVDEESGSKMDIHNLSTVITPNILYSASSAEDDSAVSMPTPSAADEDSSPSAPIGGLAGDSYFLAIEAVNTLIENHETLAVVPEDIIEKVLAGGDLSGDLASPKQV